MMKFQNAVQNKLIAASSLLLLNAACMTTSPRDSDAEPESAEKVAPVQVAPEECIRYVQLKRDSDFECELPDGSTRPIKKGERRSTPMSKDEIEKVIRSYSEEFVACFEKHQPKNTKAEGKVYISIDVESEGKVSGAKYNSERSTYKNAELGQCLADKAKMWRFPVLYTEETLQINYPFQVINSESDAAPSEDSSPK
jgi:hypothetical protein